VYVVRSDLALAGYACVPLTPFSIKDYERLEDQNPPLYSFAMAYTSVGGMAVKTTFSAMMRMPTMTAELEALARRTSPSRTIYVCHAPPYGTALDTVRGRHAGSKAIRQFIETYQPPLTLHGHIHEAPQTSHRYAEQIGRTWAVNPGHDRQQFGAIYLDTADIVHTMQHTIYGPLATSVREVGR
jgi:Icc-related predicted phosphoesterase